MVVLGGIVAILMAGSYWSRLKEGRLLIQMRAGSHHASSLSLHDDVPTSSHGSVANSQPGGACRVGTSGNAPRNAAGSSRGHDCGPLGTPLIEDAMNSMESIHPALPMRPIEEPMPSALPEVASEHGD